MHASIILKILGTLLMLFSVLANFLPFVVSLVYQDGMYFSFYTDSLPRGRTYQFEFLIRRNGIDKVIKDAASKFKIV